MSDVAPYRAKKKYPLFAAAWEEALDRSRQGLIAIAYQRAVEGRETVIIRKGENISAKEVEDIIYTHPKVKDCAVIGLLNRERGERVCLYVPGSGSNLVSTWVKSPQLDN